MIKLNQIKSLRHLLLLLLQIKMKPVLRRLLTRGLAVIPAVIVAAVMGDKAVGQLLVISQVGSKIYAHLCSVAC
jgi:Mn2+/Fe2+ NRAMP family transporter